MEVDAKEYKEEMEQKFDDIAKETRDSQRAVMQVLIPLNATILIGILGLANAFQLGNSKLSSIFTLISCFCIFLSLFAFIFSFGHMLLYMANSIYDIFESLVDANFAITYNKEKIFIKNPNLFINPLFVIIGFICFSLGMLNIAWAFLLRFNNIGICWVILTNLVLLVGIAWLLYPFLKRNVKVADVFEKVRKK